MMFHEVIWLQYEDDSAEISGPADGTTWCQDKVNDNDIRYLKATPLLDAAPELLQALYTALCFVEDAEGDMGYAPGFVRKALLEIRAAIQKAEGKS